MPSDAQRTSNWTWYDPDGDNGLGTDFKVAITASQVAWRYDEDRYAKAEEQTHADFVEFGPLWDVAPPNVLAEMADYFGLKAPMWLTPGYQHYSAAWWAISQGGEAKALELVTGEGPYRRFHKQRTLLMQAAGKEMRGVVELLLQMGADANAMDDAGRTALIEACNQYCPASETAKLAIVKLLFQRGAEVNHCDQSGLAALACAASQADASVELIDLLLESGADQFTRASVCAIFHNNQALAFRLIDLGAKPWESPGVLREAVVRDWDVLVERLLREGANPNDADSAGHTAIQGAQSEKVRKMLLAAVG